MRNDSATWASPRAEGLDWQDGGMRLRHLVLARQTLVSGTDVLRAFGPAEGESYTVALRRDRVLLVNGPDMADGWDAARGHAVTDMTAGFAAFELSGPHLDDLLLRGAEMLPSRSAVRDWAGLEVILYRHGGPDTVRMHIARARAESLVETVQRRLAAMMRQVSGPAPMASPRS